MVSWETAASAVAQTPVARIAMPASPDFITNRSVLLLGMDSPLVSGSVVECASPPLMAVTR
jgi:hypothetical protein